MKLNRTVSRLLPMSVMILAVFFAIIATSSDQHRVFNDGTIAFEYPSGWKSFPVETIEQMKRQMSEELQKYKRQILDLQMFISPEEGAAFFISKTSTGNPLSPQDLLAERQNVDRDALSAGYLTKVNALEIVRSNAGSIVVEDVERNDGQRARSVKILISSFIYEVTLAVSDKSNYEKYKPYIRHVIQTLRKAK